jgi:hypothetical protein
LPLEGIKILDQPAYCRVHLHAHDEPNGCGGHKIGPTNGLYVHHRKLTGFPLFHTPITAKQLIIDYETPEGYRQIVEEIKTADVLVEQFRPGAMENFNLSSTP